MLQAYYDEISPAVPVTLAYNRRTGDLAVTVDPSCPDGPVRFDIVNALLVEWERLERKPLLRDVG